MGVTTSQQISNYYDLYRDIEITFTKEVIRTLNLDPRQIYVKCAGSQWPCIINSTSFQSARIIIGTKGGAYAQLKDEKSSVNLRFCFIQSPTQQVSFFVTGRITSIDPYTNSNDLAIVTLTFTQKPPDDLIEIIGQVLEANSNALRRKEERIVISEESKRRLNLTKEETLVFVDNVPRHCIIRDLSFSGAKIILLGLAQFLQDKVCVLRLEFDDPREVIGVQGKIVATDIIQGRKDLVAVSIRFLDEAIPMSYKLHISAYMASTRKKQLAQHNMPEKQGTQKSQTKADNSDSKVESETKEQTEQKENNLETQEAVSNSKTNNQATTRTQTEKSDQTEPNNKPDDSNQTVSNEQTTQQN